ncbi:heme ABC transporter ATP-binding protein [Jeotgalibacillus malaysiensis]|uniref:Heme ABC transporter ATP-binding protein n=1 Tax=Jeotgalibacillus malaysiensis TaxID=1508404 RepID=A0A0B5AT05_9BACL|nr:heme ABC transporter ATP-binding protein [Jeotgalibacillus malaysiensis]
MNKDDKIALAGTDEIAKTTLMRILMGEVEPDSGSFKWGVTTSQSYFRTITHLTLKVRKQILWTG